MIRYAKLPLTADIKTIQQEVTQLSHRWIPHLNQSHYTGNWEITSLRSPGGSTDNNVPDITTGGQEFEDTPLMHQCPAIKAFVGSLQCGVQSVRLMNLKSGAEIKPHRDFDLCYENGEARLHIPVFTNSGVRFCCEADVIPMQEGQCWYLNANITHSVANKGIADRIHLVIDCVVNPWLQQVFERAEKNEAAEVPDISVTLAMIDALKTHNTPQADVMIASLEEKLRNAPQVALRNWIPARLRKEGMVEWLYTEQQPYTEPFFDETIMKCRSLSENSHGIRSFSGCDVLPAWSMQHNAVKPSAIIFHVSRCGSTLLSQLLGLDQRHIVLAEVPFFDELLRAQYSVYGKNLTHLLPHAVSFYGQKRRGNEHRLFIKADSWHFFFYEEWRALYPDVPFLLLYRRPDEVIASQEKRRGMHAVPGVIENEIFKLGQLPPFHLNPNAYMAAVLEQYYQRMQQIHAADTNTFLFNYNEGLAAIAEKMYTLTQTPLTAEAQQAMAQRCGFDAKEPLKTFAEQTSDDSLRQLYMDKAFQGYELLEQLRLQHSQVQFHKAG